MFKKIKRSFVNFHEWIFKRKELHESKLKVSFLKDDVEERIRTIEGQASQLRMLKSGDSMNLTHNEKGMILNAIEHIPFREFIELPDTKAHIRITWRELREKVKLHLKEDHEAKEDDETKGAYDA